jgi:hypothetical protein
VSNAQQRLRRRAIPVLVCYFAVFFAVWWVFEHHRAHGVLAFVLAALPALPLIGAIILIGRYIHEETDEFKRAVMVEAILWGAGLTMVVTTLWGFVELFNPIVRLSAVWVFTVFCVMVVISKLLVRRRYQ